MDLAQQCFDSPKKLRFCVHVCMCACVCVGESGGGCRVLTRRTVHIRCVPRPLSILYWESGSHAELAFTDGHSWQESLLQEFLCLDFPVLGRTGMHCCTWLLRQVLGIHTQFPRLAWQTPYPGSHLPSPHRFIVWGTAGFRWGCGDLTGHDLHAKGSYGAGSWCSRKGI